MGSGHDLLKCQWRTKEQQAFMRISRARGFWLPAQGASGSKVYCCRGVCHLKASPRALKAKQLFLIPGTQKLLAMGLALLESCANSMSMKHPVWLKSGALPHSSLCHV